MFAVWKLSRSGDSLVGERPSRSSAEELARQFVRQDKGYVMVVEGDNVDCHYSGAAIISEYAYLHPCWHDSLDEDEAVANGGYCPVCGRPWLATGKVQEIYRWSEE